MKRFLSMLLVAAVAIALFAGVGQPAGNAAKAELAPVTLKWMIPGFEKEGTRDVIEAFNEKLAALLPNTTVEFVFTGNTWEYGDPWNMAMAAGEVADLAWYGWMNSFSTDIPDGTVLDITDLIARYAPNLQAEAELWKASYDSCTVDGRIYGIPSIQPSCGANWVYTFNKEKLGEYFDLDAFLAERDASPNGRLTQGMLDIIDAAYAEAIEKGTITLGEASWKAYYGANERTTGYLPILDNSYGIYYDTETNEVVYCWETKEARMLALQRGAWYDKGYITEAMILGQVADGATQYHGVTGNNNLSWLNADERGIYETTGNGRTTVNILNSVPTDSYKGTSSLGSASSYMVVPFTAKNPERAIMLLDILHGEVGTAGNDLINLLCYGFEEKSEEAAKYGWCNYTAVEEDGQMKVDTAVRGGAESKHELTNWVMGNTYKIMHDGGSLTSTANKEYCEKYWAEIYPQMKTCAISGMAVDTSAINDELNAMALVFKEYAGQLDSGVAGAEGAGALMDEAMAKMNEAGWQTVKAELESQIAAYNAEK